MGVILDQTKNLEVLEQNCPICGRKILPTWSQCPYCLVDQNENIIHEKSASITPIGQELMCPVCKKILNPNGTAVRTVSFVIEDFNQIN